MEGDNVESCWLIEFDNEEIIILSEYLYKKEKERNFNGKKVLCEQHWFDYKYCRERNPHVKALGLK